MGSIRTRARDNDNISWHRVQVYIPVGTKCLLCLYVLIHKYVKHGREESSALDRWLIQRVHFGILYCHVVKVAILQYINVRDLDVDSYALTDRYNYIVDDSIIIMDVIGSFIVYIPRPRRHVIICCLCRVLGTRRRNYHRCKLFC